MMAMGEVFRRDDTGRVFSSLGYSIWLHGRDGFEFRDERGTFEIGTTETVSSCRDIRVHIHSMIDLEASDLEKNDLVGKLRRALEYDGWKLVLDDFRSSDSVVKIVKDSYDTCSVARIWSSAFSNARRKSFI